MSELMVPSGIISLKKNEHCTCTAPGPPCQQVCLWPPAGWWGAPWVGSVCLLPFRTLSPAHVVEAGTGNRCLQGPGHEWLLPFWATECCMKVAADAT